MQTTAIHAILHAVGRHSHAEQQSEPNSNRLWCFYLNEMFSVSETDS